MNIFEWVLNKKQLEEEMDQLDKTINTLKIKNAKMHDLEKQLEIIEEREIAHIDTIKELKKELKVVKSKLTKEINKNKKGE